MAKQSGASAIRTHLTLTTYTRFPRRRLPAVFRDSWMNVYPDTVDDILGGPKRDVDYDAIVLENEYLKLTILPELGGKLWSVWDKRAKRDGVHVPDVVKPGLIGYNGAWIPGGMEFNFPIGHIVGGMAPTPCHIEQTGPQMAAAVIQRRCARTGMHMDVKIMLRAGEARFDIAYTPVNPTALSHRWYHWTNVGVTTSKDWRFFSKAKWYHTGSALHPYPISEKGVDTSFSRNRPVGSDSFMVAHCEDFFGSYDYGTRHGIAHVAPWQQMRGKKYFTWGWTFRDYSDGTIFSDRGMLYNEIQAGPMETQSDFAILPPGGSVHYQETWIPFSKIGGIEWANRDLLFMVQNNRPWVYAARELELKLRIGGRSLTRRLAPAVPVVLPGKVEKGTRVEIRVDGKLERAFNYPLQGRQEPGGIARLRQRHAHWPHKPPKTAKEFLDQARRAVKWERYRYAIERYRKSLRLNSRQHAVRMELADALWHLADFAGGVRELQKLRKTPLATQARDMLARRAQAEAAFMAPVLAVPEGPARDLALAERLAGYGGYDAARKNYRKLADTDPRNPRVHYGLAAYFWHAKYKPARAVPHAERALELRPRDRDLILELAPLFAQTGDYPRVLEIVNQAPPAVRNLYLCQKLLATAYFELGQDKRCWDIVSQVRLHNWEGEFQYADLYIDCALALAEQALVQGDLAAATRLADAAGKLPVIIGINQRKFSSSRYGYWQGLCRIKAGRTREAHKIWREALALFDRQREASSSVYSRNWSWALPDESVYMYDLCRKALGEKGNPASYCENIHELRNQAHGKHKQSFLEAAIHELKGEFTLARRRLKTFLRNTSEKRIAQMHLDALKSGRRRGEI